MNFVTSLRVLYLGLETISFQNQPLSTTHTCYMQISMKTDNIIIIYYLDYETDHKVQRKLMVLSTSIKSNARPSEPFHTNINSSKSPDTDATQGSKQRKNWHEQNCGDTHNGNNMTNAKSTSTKHLLQQN